jgi:hypothetical protein
MGNVARKLNAAEAKAIEEEYHSLAVKLETQALEQCAHLRKCIAKDDKLSKAKQNMLLQLLEVDPVAGRCEGFHINVFRITDANVLQKPHVQVTYDIDDDLYAYLRQADSLLPKQLVGFLDGGTVLDANKATAEDPMPQTGKTKAY